MPVTTTYDANVSPALAAEAKLQQSAARLSAGYKDAARSANEMEKFSKKAFEQSLGPAEKYLQKLEQLDTLKRRGLINEQQHAAAVEKLTVAYREQGEASVAASSGAVAGLGKLVLAYGSVTSAIQLMNAELEKKYELERRASEIAVGRAGGQADALLNMGLELTSAQRKTALDDVGKLAEAAKIDKGVFLSEYAKAFSATSGDFESRRKQTSGMMAKLAPLFRGKEGELGTFAGAAIDTLGTLGNVTEDQTLAYMLTLQSQARVTSIDALKQAVPALAAVDISAGGSKWENAKLAGAMFAATGGRLGDPGGEKSNTLISNFAKTLRDVVPTDAEVPQSLLDEIAGSTGRRKKAAQAEADRIRASGRQLSLMERLERVWSDKALQDEIIPQLKGEGAGPLALEELVRGGLTATKMRDAFTAFDNIDPTALERLRADLGAVTPELAIREFQASANEATKGRLTMGDKPLTGILRSALFEGTGDEKAFFDTTDWITRKTAKKRFEIAAANDPVAAARAAVESGGFDPTNRDKMLAAIDKLSASIDRQNEIAMEQRKEQKANRKQRAVSPQP